jgi:hypothetical protein
LEKLWIQNNIKYDKKDINLLMSIIKNGSLEQFISDLQLNQEIEIVHGDGIYLSTIHGSKGLEWEHVYIIDVNSNDLPFVYANSQYFKEEINNIEEERRLFYVASSRAKSSLTISYYVDNTIEISPFIKELDKDLYNYSDCVKLHLLKTKNISSNYRNNLHNLDIKEKIIHKEINHKFPRNFLTTLIFKIIQNNNYSKIIGFDVNGPKDYLNKKIHWLKILETIYTTSQENLTNNNLSSSHLQPVDSKIISEESILIYKDIEVGLQKLINMCFLNSENLYINYNINLESIQGNVDLLFDDVIVDVKASTVESCTLTNLSKLLLFGYVLHKKNITINKIIFYNATYGTIKILDTSKFNFQSFYNNSIGNN